MTMSAEPPQRAAKGPTARPHVVVLGTGGTIAGAASALSKASYTSAVVPIATLLGAIPSLSEIAHLSFDQVAAVGGQAMTDALWLVLAARVEAELARPDVAGVVVTHGTDTLEETAFLLSLVIGSVKPVVVTGATRPASAPGSDGPANLRDAVVVAASRGAVGRGVMVAFDGAIFAPRHVVRVRIHSGREFASGMGGAIGTVSANGPRFLDPRPSSRSRRLALPAQAPFPRVEIIYSHVNAMPDLAEAAVAAGAKGLVLAGTGNGNSSPGVIEALARAARDGVVVVRASRVVGGGVVERNIEVEDDLYGFVAAGDLDTPKARILTQLLVANDIVDPVSIQAMFDGFEQA